MEFCLGGVAWTPYNNIAPSTQKLDIECLDVNIDYQILLYDSSGRLIVTTKKLAGNYVFDVTDVENNTLSISDYDISNSQYKIGDDFLKDIEGMTDKKFTNYMLWYVRYYQICIIPNDNVDDSIHSDFLVLMDWVENTLHSCLNDLNIDIIDL